MTWLRPTSCLLPSTTLFRSRRRRRSPRPGAPAPSRTTPSSRPPAPGPAPPSPRSEEHTSELQSLRHLVCRRLLEKKKHDAVIELFVYAKHWGWTQSAESTTV